MSVVSLSDLLFGDLLTEKNMKPWWEKVRGYIFAGSVAFALSATYLTLNGIALNCLPIETGNVSFACEFTARQAAWTNSYCSNRLPWYINYFGGISLATALCLLGVSSYWLHKPKVIDSFVTFIDMEEKVTKSGITQDDLVTMSCEPINNDVSGGMDEKRYKLREVCVQLWKGGRACDLIEIYNKRNYLLIASSSVAGIFFCVLAYCMIADGDLFECRIEADDQDLIHGSHLYAASFACVAPMACRMIVFNVIFIISIFLQIAPIIYGMWKWTSRKEVLPGYINVDFMRFFWKYAQPSHSEKFSRFIEYICGESAVTSIQENLSKAIEVKDYAFVSYFVLLNAEKAESGKTLMEDIQNIYRKAVLDMNRKAANDNIEVADWTEMEKMIITACSHLPNETPENAYQDFLAELSTQRRWRLLAGILHEFVSKDKKMGVSRGSDLLKRLDLDYDKLDDHGCSIFYYFIDERHRLTLHPIAKYVNATSGNPFKLYVHCNGNSFYVTDKIQFEGIENLVEVDGLEPPSCGKSQKEIADLIAPFRSLIGGSSTAADEFDQRLSLIKFQKWDEHAKELARLAFEHEKWRTFITLLNSYVVRHSERENVGPLPCGVTDVGRIAIIEVLCHSFTLSNVFVPTAARHIITYLTPQKREKCVGVVRNSTLDVIDQESLVRFIRECNDGVQRHGGGANDGGGTSDGGRSIITQPDDVTNSRNENANEAVVGSSGQITTSAPNGNANNMNNIQPHGGATSNSDTRIDIYQTPQDDNKPLLAIKSKPRERKRNRPMLDDLLMNTEI